MARLVANVHVKDPKTHQMVELRAGEEPAPHLAALVRSPDAWEGGELPGQADDPAGDGTARLILPVGESRTVAPELLDAVLAVLDQGTPAVEPDPVSSDGASTGEAPTEPVEDTPTQGDTTADAKPAAKKQSAAKRPARGRTAADEGTGGE